MVGNMFVKAEQTFTDITSKKFPKAKIEKGTIFFCKKKLAEARIKKGLVKRISILEIFG